MTNFLKKYKTRFNDKYLVYNFSSKYTLSTDTSHINYPLSAKKGEFFIKNYTEHRDVDVLFVLDISSSQLIGSKESKFTKMCSLVEKICDIANKAGDRVGIMTFDAKVINYFPVNYSNLPLNRLSLDKNFDKAEKCTDPIATLTCLRKILKKRTVLFWVSDFIYPDKIRVSMMENMKQLSKKHDLICIQLTDFLDINFPNIGKVYLEGAESGEIIMCNTSKKIFKEKLILASNKWCARLNNDMKKLKIKFIQGTTSSSIEKILEKCFDKRLA